MPIEPTLIYFLLLVAFGAVIQTMTGFAMGLVIIAGVAAFGIAELSYTAAVISLISLTNTLIALRKSHGSIDRDLLLWMSVGLLPTMVVGVIILEYLASHATEFLRMLLGIVIIIGGLLLMVTPKPYASVSGKPYTVSIGVLGGLFAGLYSAGGAPLAYFMYRQPLALDVIRSTLLATFAISTAWRTGVIVVAGQFTQQLALTVAASIPVVVVVTMLVGRGLHLVPDRFVRRLVFVLLIGTGLFLIVT